MNGYYLNCLPCVIQSGRDGVGYVGMAGTDGGNHPLKGGDDLIKGLQLIGLLPLVYDVLVGDGSSNQVSVVSNAVHDAFQMVVELSEQIMSN